ncbi:LysE family translocator [Helicobacter sp. MIT 14-3879]|uniref:LysE family translocator n=1 Tax=Helicobacter sp. MIT 14-3879 TaxID=2040649 RepID=UPI000E1F31C5|nr:LysE family transporter [Helicobacter sp. MIT 14-3879]RDU63498.1 hypothetical protein CQA44_05255 [Helicobacter sp. MIT 14-3879]
MNAFIEGIKLGFMFQILIGPICFFLLQVAISDGFLIALFGSLGVTIGDGIFIILAILGVGKIFEKFPHLRKISGFIGMLILISYGIYIIINSILLSTEHNPQNTIKNGLEILCYGLILTLSNPITILYWSGSFAIHLSKMTIKRNIYKLGLGAFITTPIFLIVWVGLGAYFGKFIPKWAIFYLHISIGILLCYYGIKTYIKVLSE